MEKGIVFYPSTRILESDISKMSHDSTVVLSKFLEKVFTLKKKNSLNALFLPLLPFFPINSHPKPWCFFHELNPTLPPLPQIMLPLQITNVSSRCKNHLVKTRSLSWLVEWVLFHSVSTHGKVGKKVLHSFPSPHSPLESLFWWCWVQLWSPASCTSWASDNRDSSYFPICRPFVPKVFLLYCTNHGLYIFLYIMSYFIISK